MANEWIPSTGAIVAAVLTPFLTAFVPRLWQDDMRRLRSVSETRVKNLEALEKVLSLATKAKEELGIEVPTHELQNELKKIVHEFAGPVVLSREALEEWESRPSKERLRNFPHFTFPPGDARRSEIIRNVRSVALVCYMLYYPMLFLIMYYVGLNFIELISYKTGWNVDLTAFILYFGLPVYFMSLFSLGVVGRVITLRTALRKIRAMPNSGAEGQTGPVIVQPLPEEALQPVTTGSRAM
jgi:hypothetical protein